MKVRESERKRVSEIVRVRVRVRERERERERKSCHSVSDNVL